MTSMSCTLERAIWSRDTGQQIPCFDRCQLFITWISNIKEVHGKPRMHVHVNIIFGVCMAAMLRDSVVAVVAVARPRAIPLSMITMRKSIHGFLFPIRLWGSVEPLELRYQTLKTIKVPITPKYFFRLNNSLHLFETHCAFLHLFSPNLDFLQAVKVTKSDHNLFHDRASKGYGSIPGLMSQTYLHACLQRLNTMQISL